MRERKRENVRMGEEWEQDIETERERERVSKREIEKGTQDKGREEV